MRLNFANTALKNMAVRLFVFFAIFVVVTGIIGPWVISTPLLYGFNFYIYGNAGKVAFFWVIAFLVLTKGKLGEGELPDFSFTKKGIFFGVSGLLLAFLLIPVFFFLSELLLLQESFEENLLLSLFTHLILILIPVVLAIGVLGSDLIKYFFDKFKKEIVVCLSVSLIIYFSIFQVWKLWPLFSDGVLKSVYFLFSLFTTTKIITPRTLVVDGFGARIEQACSGVDSLFLFTALYLFIVLVDWKILNIRKAILLFIPAAAGLYITNILRIFLIMLIGAKISPKIALSLFHTYAGLVLFLIYFGLFMKFFYKRLKKVN